ncbi:MAG: hypothetical protein ACXW27_09020 [Allosphingosinicella sp.]
MSSLTTPGPWRQKLAGYGIEIFGADRPHIPVAVVEKGGRISEERDANANLIAAAPDLLAAAQDAEVEIRELREWIRTYVPSHAVPSEDWGKLHKPLVTQTVTRNLRAAVAKARGE